VFPHHNLISIHKCDKNPSSVGFLSGGEGGEGITFSTTGELEIDVVVVVH
jgi:hypothetical protein